MECYKLDDKLLLYTISRTMLNVLVCYKVLNKLLIQTVVLMFGIIYYFNDVHS